MPQTAPGAIPPPLPPRPSPPPRPAPSDDTRLRGCLIALAVIAVGAIPVLGVLVAIAVPAYNDYRRRAEVAQVLAEAEPLKPRLADFVRSSGRCPGDGELGPMPAALHGGPFAQEVRLGGTAGICWIDVVLRGEPDGPLDGRRLRLEYDPVPAQWRCRGEVDHRYLPVHCRA